MQFIKKTASEIILDAINKGIEIGGDLMYIFLTDYSTSYRRAKNMVYGRGYSQSNTVDFERKQKQRFYSLVNRLQEQGLIEKRISKDQTKFHLTNLGSIKSEKLLNRFKASKKIEKQEIIKENKLKIIIFDIPEKEKHKRNWLRKQLVELEFKMLQKSVWLGKNKIPLRLIQDFQNFKIMPYIHIFYIDNKFKGTLD